MPELGTRAELVSELRALALVIANSTASTLPDLTVAEKRQFSVELESVAQRMLRRPLYTAETTRTTS